MDGTSSKTGASMKITSLILSIAMTLVGAAASAISQQVDLTTPRGSLIKLDIYNPGLSKLLLLAPGSGCGKQLSLYNTLATQANEHGFTVVRLYWAYCIQDSENGRPTEISQLSEDFLTALDYSRNVLKFSDDKIFAGGKSLGSVVSYDVFHSMPSLQGLVLLTPLCTDRKDPNNRSNRFHKSYKGLESESRLVLLIQGNNDDYCDTKHFQEYLAGKPSNFIPLVTKGDHSFAIQNPDGSENDDLTKKNKKSIAAWIFSWLP
jgi:predicted alpha/beta-hydrolase family hydrolase